eukprot:CAMPEP_0206036432 /NCGR_PEP_ID=MMETSP1466-20131121/2769_1 /ASSEMBLY_ACC=CAM_ASM_001126 /TAXON_ID=44452 /ORGANISM="Pavlova gyrans, Strain CCMP608" /LENGTH=137 /DNA_ID=CAMNT_0053410905 /DNA_START=284 /DNA_END=697 /DNA_ORIENTATION=-
MAPRPRTAGPRWQMSSSTPLALSSLSNDVGLRCSLIGGDDRIGRPAKDATPKHLVRAPGMLRRHAYCSALEHQLIELIPFEKYPTQKHIRGRLCRCRLLLIVRGLLTRHIVLCALFRGRDACIEGLSDIARTRGLPH